MFLIGIVLAVSVSTNIILGFFVRQWLKHTSGFLTGFLSSFFSVGGCLVLRSKESEVIIYEVDEVKLIRSDGKVL